MRLSASDPAPAPLEEELARLAFAQRPSIPEEDDEDGMETVLESHWGDAAPLDQLLTEERWSVPTPGMPDPHTEWRDRMPVAFITDSVMDERTVEDPATDARQWREQALFDLNPALPRQDLARPDPPSHSDAAQASSPLPPAPPRGLRTVTPPLGGHQRGVPHLAEWDASMSPSPPYRQVAPSWAPPAPSPVQHREPPGRWWEEHLPAMIGGAAVGLLLGALYILARMV